MPEEKTPQTQNIPDVALALEQRVVEFAGQGKLKEAVQAADQLTRSYPHYGEGWHTASHLALQLKNPEAALRAIDKALSGAPGNVPWQLHRARCLVQLELHGDARTIAVELSGQSLSSAAHCASLGLLLSQLDLMVEAGAQYRRAIELAPEQAGSYYNLATVQRALGDLGAAQSSLSRAIELDPRDYDAWYAQSELRKQSREHNHVQELEALVESDIDNPKAQVQILYALAKELEDIDKPEQSFGYLQRGAALRRQHLNYRVANDLDTMAQIRQAYTADMFDGHIDGCASREPIFVLGLPRTGTTLVERILGSHSRVYAAGELNNFPRQMMRGVRSLVAERGGSEKDNLPALSTGLDFRQLGEAYIHSTRPVTGHCGHFVDKLPLNFLHAGQIQLALPGARIIHLRRHPLDSCYAMYKTLFRDAYPFSYDLRELGDYYLAYRELMAHWQACMPGVIHEVNYEDLVTDIEHETRRLLAYCGLPWEDQCLRFHENAAASTTASAVQVRREIYRSSVGKWRLYENQLEPLARQLMNAGIDIGEAAMSISKPQT